MLKTKNEMNWKLLDSAGAILLLLLSAHVVQAQESLANRDYIYRPVTVSVFPPLSTNGLESADIVSRVSLNLLAGYQAGLDGVEFGGLANLEKDFVKGAQFAGFGNYVGEEVQGAQFAGFMNLNGSWLEGGQFAGFLNIAGDSVSGAQGAGFLNIAGGSVEGLQGAGFLNMAAGDVRGVQGSGFLNIAGGSLLGVQGTGFLNIAGGSFHGGQGAGFMNLAGDSSEAVQGAGFLNLVTGSMKGVQVAGFANIATRDVEGVQASGFLNVAQRLNGLQLGVINVSDTVESGVPLGWLSVVKRGGYRSLELFGGYSTHTGLAFKIGVPRFYNIFVLGATFSESGVVPSTGYGIGTRIPLGERWDIELDGLAYHYYEFGWFDNFYYWGNLTYQLRPTVSRYLTERVALFVAPTFNYYPDAAFRYSWIGGNAGLRFRLTPQ